MVQNLSLHDFIPYFAPLICGQGALDHFSLHMLGATHSTGDEAGRAIVNRAKFQTETRPTGRAAFLVDLRPSQLRRPSDTLAQSAYLSARI
jgi:hypothetical protein